jgi:hypothetical protein
MGKGIVMAAIIAGAILVAGAAMVYFSPYQSCVRAQMARLGSDLSPSERATAQNLFHVSCAGVAG